MHPLTLTVLPAEIWRAREEAHEERADAFTREHVARRKRGEKHPIEDFLFTYYNLTPAQLRRWHPGAGVSLESVRDEEPRTGWKDYVRDAEGLLRVDAEAFLSRRGPTVDYIETLLSNTMDRPPSLGCFGLHEWAMVYRLTPEELRHRGLRLRLGATLTDEVVETHPIACSHFDAFRFFTPEAAPLNSLRPTRESQAEMEQPGCLHAGMDIYKWTMKLGPLVPGELLLDTFELALDIRRIDMQASPYDVTEYGLAPVKIETPQGKSEYASYQRGFMERGNALRLRVLDAIRQARQ